MTTETMTRGPAIKLDWSRLLGFDQVPRNLGEATANQLNDPRLALLGGGKMGINKPGGRRPEL